MAVPLANIRRNKPKPPRIIPYGESGLGKTTFAVSAPNPIVIQTEDGLGILDVPAFPKAQSFAEVMESIDSLLTEDHEFKTVVIDSLDWLEPLIWAEVCENFTDNKGNVKPLKSIEDAGYGKGYVDALSYWRAFFDHITRLRDERGMIIIMTAHSTIVKVEDPSFPAYDSHSLKLHKRACALAEEYADIIGYCELETFTKTEETGFNQKRTRATTSGTRVIHLEGSAAFTAKNRYQMPAKLELDWHQFASHLPKI